MGCFSSKKKINLPEPEIIAGYLVLSGLKKKSFGKGRWYLKVSHGGVKIGENKEGEEILSEIVIF